MPRRKVQIIENKPNKRSHKRLPLKRPNPLGSPNTITRPHWGGIVPNRGDHDGQRGRPGKGS